MQQTNGKQTNEYRTLFTTCHQIPESYLPFSCNYVSLYSSFYLYEMTKFSSVHTVLMRHRSSKLCIYSAVGENNENDDKMIF